VLGAELMPGRRSVGAAVLIADVSLCVAAVAVTLLSLDDDMTQPLLAGIVTALGGTRRALPAAAGSARGLCCTPRLPPVKGAFRWRR